MNTKYSQETPMNDFLFRRILRLLTVAVASLTFAGCGQGMSGKYGNEIMQVEFKGGKAYVSMGIEGLSRTTTEVNYELKGDKIILHNQAGNLVLTRNKDGTLSGPMDALAGPLRRQSGSASSAKSVASADRSRPAPPVSGVEREATDVVLAEIGKHCLKGPDGSWITLMTAGSSWAPEHFYRQFRDITVDAVEATELSDADHMNGFEWAGEITFKPTIAREIGDPGLSHLSNMQMIERQQGHWTQWIDFQPQGVPVQKFKGQWQVKPSMGMFEGDPLLSGALPPATVFSTVNTK
jgi:hypothetical protein